MARKQAYPFVFTPRMKKRLSKRVLDMLQRALRRFPELGGKAITVGYTTAHLGSAVVPQREEAAKNLTIRLKVKRLTYQTIGHEMTHLLQGLSKIQMKAGRRQRVEPIPYGEKQCDIWTLARSRLFCDDAPTYLRLPRAVRENWPDYSQSVRRLCIAALEKRKSHRLYIQWLEARIKDLAKKPRGEPKPGEQMALPF